MNDESHSYRRILLIQYIYRYHPDKNKEEGAEDKFVQIAHGEHIYLHIPRKAILNLGNQHMKSCQTPQLVDWLFSLGSLSLTIH